LADYRALGRISYRGKFQ